MPNFGIAFAMPCTEAQFNNDGSVRLCLRALGYDLSQLVFYPNKPYVATNYKNKSALINTSNDPYNNGRKVLEEWNQILFIALASQLSGESITQGEWFVDGNGDVLQCTGFVGDNYLRYTSEGFSDCAALKSNSRKATFEDLARVFSDKIVSPKESEEIVVKPRLKPGPKLKIKTEEAASHPSLIEAGKKIVDCFKGKSVEEMQDTLSKIPASEKNGEWNDRLPDSERTLMREPLPLNKEIILQSKANDLIEGPMEDAEKTYNGITTEDLLKKPLNESTYGSFEVNSIPAPLTFQEILERFGEGKTVVYGQVLNDISCSPERHIVSVSKTHVDLEEEIVKVDQSIIFAGQAEFLQYALQKISQL